jgi:hypothetical protein
MQRHQIDIKLPIQMPVAIGNLNASSINTELEKGYADIAAGRLHELDDVASEMNRSNGV